MRNIFFSTFILLNISFLIDHACSQQNNKDSSHLNNETTAYKIIELGPLSNKKSILNDPLIPEIAQHIQKKYGVHTVILFGSRARGTATNHSDYDIIGLQKSGEKQQYQELFKGAYLEIFIYPQSLDKKAIAEFPTPSFWQEGIILAQPHHEGEQFTNVIKKAFEDGQTDLSLRKKNAILLLATNLRRGQTNEIREHFYRRKFLMLALEKYPSIHNFIFMGARKTLEWLQKNDPLTYVAFNKALDPNASTEELYELLVHVAGPGLDSDIKIKNEDQKSVYNNQETKEKYVFSKDPLLPDIVHHIQKTHGAHTVILYGSRAQGTASLKSDYDLIALRGPGTIKESARDLFKGAYLDLHFLPDEILKDPNFTSFLSIVEGANVLCQKNDMGDRLIQRAEKIYDQGFFTSDQVKNRVLDEIKMNLWKVDNTLEGRYYQNAVISSLLEHYFTLHNLYYIGSRESFGWLKKNDLPTYLAFEKAVKPGASIESTKELVDRIISGTVYESK